MVALLSRKDWGLPNPARDGARTDRRLGNRRDEIETNGFGPPTLCKVYRGLERDFSDTNLERDHVCQSDHDRLRYVNSILAFLRLSAKTRNEF